MDLKRIIGQCAPLFFLAVTYDLVGFILLLVGLAASPRIGERVYGDFLALTGAILMFFGLGMWVMWYAGNLGADGKRSGFKRITRRLSKRMSSMRMTGDCGGNAREEERKVEEDEQKVEEEKQKLEEDEQKVEEDEQKVEEEEQKVEEDEQKVEEEKQKVEEDEQKVEEEKQKVEEEEGKEQDEGKSGNDGGYINEAYEPTESETV